MQITIDTATLKEQEVIGLANLLDNVSQGALTRYFAAELRETWPDATPPTPPANPVVTDGPTDPASAFPPFAPSAGASEPDATDATPPPAVDAAGLPWDARIHSDSKALNKDGTWRQRRNVAPSLVETVTAELRGQTPAPTAPTPPPTAPTPPPPPPADPAPVIAPSVTAAPTPPPPPPAGEPGPAEPPMQAFTRLMGLVSPASATGKLTPDEINGACAAVGIPNLAASLTQPHVIPTLQAQFEALIAAKG